MLVLCFCSCHRATPALGSHSWQAPWIVMVSQRVSQTFVVANTCDVACTST